MDLFRKSQKIGGGGWNCYCCGPNGNKAMKRIYRHKARQVLKRMMQLVR